MTLKRKVFISNILTLVIPLAFTASATLIIIMLYMNIAGIPNTDTLFEGNFFNRSVYETNELSKKWTPETKLTEIKKDVDAFNSRYKRKEVILYVYSGEKPLFEGENREIDAAIYEKLKNFDEETIIIVGDSAFYSIESEPYTLITIVTNYSLENFKFNIRDFNPGFIIIILTAAIITVSFIFSRYLSKSITTPIKILIDGVYQIRDGNLSFRIYYDKKDEFAGVCESFNEMAKRLQDSVEQQQKDESSRKELIAGISHDLRTPLTSIKAYVEGLEKGIANTPRLYKRYIDTIKNKSTELENIIEQLFLFSKIDIGDFPFHFKKADIALELQTYIGEIQDEYKNKGLQIRLNTGGAQLFSNIDAQQFRNIISNILENSAKYKEKDTGEISITCYADNNKIIIELCDDGPGVQEASLDKLFDVFYRGDPSRSNKKSGSGLGLAITAKMLERMGGGIRAKNNPDSGLTMIITLPADL